MRKKIFFIVLTIFIFTSSNFVYADDYIEDDDFDIFADDILQTASDVEGININSRIAVAYDRDTGRVVWGKNENKKTAMASTTKIMTAIVVIENSNLDETIVISAKAAGIGGSRLGLKQGDKLTVRDLLYGLMLRSGNDAAVALAEHVGGDVENFANLMNDKVRWLNLKNTHFVTPHGLDNPEHYTTAYELAQIADYALKNEIFAQIVGSKNYTITINGYAKSLCNTNELLGCINGVYGVKTGFTNNAGRCLVTSVKRNNMDIITVVIQADTKKDRSRDSIKIIDYIFQNFEKINIEEIVNKEYLNWYYINTGRILVARAQNDAVNLQKNDVTNKTIIINKADINSVRIEINGIYNYEAPVEEKTKFGELKVFVGDELLEIEDICFSNKIKRKEIQNYIYQCVQSIKNIWF